MKAAEWILGLAFVAGLVSVSVFAHGVALHYLWGWYVVPIFGAPPMSWAQAMGVTLAVQLILPRTYPPKDEYKRIATGMVLNPLIALLIGWALRHWA